MEPPAPDLETTADLRALQRALTVYRAPLLSRSILELAITVIPFVLFWFLTWASVNAGYWIGLLLAVPAAGFLVRLFMIQHDCGHGSFFPSRRANDWVGRILGVLTLTPYDFWRYTHALHHAYSGNLDRSRVGSIDTLSVREYQYLPRAQRLRYRLYRHPLVLFGVGPVYLFMLSNRVPVGFMRAGWMPWLSEPCLERSVAECRDLCRAIWWVEQKSRLIRQAVERWEVRQQIHRHWVSSRAQSQSAIASDQWPKVDRDVMYRSGCSSAFRSMRKVWRNRLAGILPRFVITSALAVFAAGALERHLSGNRPGVLRNLTVL